MARARALVGESSPTRALASRNSRMSVVAWRVSVWRELVRSAFPSGPVQSWTRRVTLVVHHTTCATGRGAAALL